MYLWAGLVGLSALLPVAAGVTAGGALGAKLLPVLPARFLGVLFAALMLAAGVKAVI